jgi:hypothetical protein
LGLLCHDIWKNLREPAEFIEYGQLGAYEAQHHLARRLVAAVRKLGYVVQLSPIALTLVMV